MQTAVRVCWSIPCINQIRDLSTIALGNRDETFSPTRRALTWDRRKCVSRYTHARIFRAGKKRRRRKHETSFFQTKSTTSNHSRDILVS